MTALKTSPRYYLGLCAIAKDETPYLREWAAYHHYIGFEKIYIYDNGSAVPVKETLDDFAASSVLTTYSVPGQAVQLGAYNHCLQHHGNECRWLAFLDLDEFLCLKTDQDARIMLRDYEQFSGLALNWDVFSSSGYLSRPAGMVMENFCETLGYSTYCKSIINPATVTKPISPHHFWYHTGSAVNANGVAALGPFIPVAADKACINHYTYRSQQDYEEKMGKGDAIYENNPRSFATFYAQASRPVTERTDILPLVLEMKESLGQGPPRLRQDMTLENAEVLGIGNAASLISKLLESENPAMAEVLFALCYHRFKSTPTFLDIGILLCRQTGKHQRALELIREKMWLTPPSNEDYVQYLKCLTDLSRKDEALEVATLLLHTAKYSGQQDLLQYVENYAAQHGLSLSDIIAI